MLFFLSLFLQLVLQALHSGNIQTHQILYLHKGITLVVISFLPALLLSLQTFFSSYPLIVGMFPLTTLLTFTYLMISLCFSHIDGDTV